MSRWGEDSGSGGFGSFGASGSGGPSRYQAGGALSGARAADFRHLQKEISSDIQQINQNADRINTLSGSIGVPAKDSQKLRSEINGLIESTRTIATDSARRMKSLTQAPGDVSDRERKIVVGKLRKELERALGSYQDASMLTKKKEASTPPPQGAVDDSRFQPYRDEEEGQRELMEERQQRQQKMMSLENERKFNDMMIKERDEGIREIEQSITEVNEIFVDLAALVEDQAPLVDNIEAHVTQSVVNVSRGVDELHSAEGYQKSARNKTIFLFVLLLIIVLIVIVVLVVVVVLGVSYASIAGVFK